MQASREERERAEMIRSSREKMNRNPSLTLSFIFFLGGKPETLNPELLNPKP